jgi:NAD(P)-dependent dehydrogenase (short-subunit alcohol dehydrogenase family)
VRGWFTHLPEEAEDAEETRGAIEAEDGTKGAIHAFTKSLARSLVSRGIRVNCVAPGPVWTPLKPSDRPADEVSHFGEETPMGRPAQPEEIAPVYVFLASNADSSYMTGEVVALLGSETRAG